MLGDDKAQAAALNVMKHRAKIMGLDQLTADKQTVANILVVGGDKQAFVEALIYGRAQSDPMAGDHLDDGDDQEDA